MLVLCFLFLFPPFPPKFYLSLCQSDDTNIFFFSLTYRDLNRYSYVVEHFDFLGMKNNVQVCTYSFFEPIKHCYKALINFLRKYTRLNYLCSFHALVYELKVIFHTLQLACEAQHLMSYHFFCWGRNGMAIIF